MNESFTVDDFLGVDVACWSQLCPLGPLVPEGEVLLQLASTSLQDAAKSWGSHLRPVPRATESEVEKEGAPICSARGLLWTSLLSPRFYIRQVRNAAVGCRGRDSPHLHSLSREAGGPCPSAVAVSGVKFWGCVARLPGFIPRLPCLTLSQCLPLRVVGGCSEHIQSAW